MDDRSLKKISKQELLELLLSQAKRIEELEVELQETKDKLNSKEIMVSEVGTLAEASLKLNGIFECAQAAVDQYLFNVEKKCQKLEDDMKEKCRMMKSEAEEYLIKTREKGKIGTKKSTDLDKGRKSKIKSKKGKKVKKRKVRT